MSRIFLLIVLVASVARAGIVDVTTLGAKNDGSADVSTIINAATAQNALYLPPGVYRVEKPLRLRHSLKGVGYSRHSKVNSNETWLVSAIPDGKSARGVIEFEKNVSATVENLNIRCSGAVNGIRVVPCSQGNMLFFERVGIFGVSSCGLCVEGGGSRPIFADNMTVWGEPGAMTRSVGIRLAGACDCRLANVEVMGTAVGLEALNGHTYGDNLHLWTGFLGGKKDPTAWWRQTRGLVLGSGANFAGSNVYPDTSYYAIEMLGKGAICEIGNIMYWEDGSVKPVTDRTGAFLRPDGEGNGRLIVHGGLVGVSGSDAKPGAMKCVYSPRQTMAGVMMKCDYGLKPANLDRLCLGGDLPDYTVSYRTNAYCKVADILTPAKSGSCEAKLVRDDGAAWRVGVVKTPDGRIDARSKAVNALGTGEEVRMTVDGDHVKVFLKAPAAFAENWTARFTTAHMGDYCRPVDHGSLRSLRGEVRYREYFMPHDD